MILRLFDILVESGNFILTINNSCPLFSTHFLSRLFTLNEIVLLDRIQLDPASRVVVNLRRIQRLLAELNLTQLGIAVAVVQFCLVHGGRRL